MRQQTPRFRTTVALAIGVSTVIRDLARYFRIIDITGATSCAIAFGEEPASTVDEGMAFELPVERRFDRITITNNQAAPITVRYAVSEDPILDDRASTFSSVLLSIDGRLNNIDVDTSGIRTDVQAVTAELQTGHLDGIETDTASIDAHAAQIETDTTAAEAHLGDIDTVLDASTIVVSTDGSYEVLTPAATTAANGADQACREVMFWTPSPHVHFKLGTTDADGNTTLLPSDVVFSIPIHNTNHLRFYNGDAAGATIYLIWRN